MAATIHDVSEKAGVAVGTVSRYLNGHNVRKDNREKIRKSIADLGFQANYHSAALRSRKSMTIGVLIYSYTDIYSTTILVAIERFLEAHGYRLMVFDGDVIPELRRRRLNSMRQRSIDGLIVFPAGWLDCEREMQRLSESGTPVIVVDGKFPGLELDRIAVDNGNASFRAMEKLIHSGHERIGIINGPEWETNARERYEGCLDALRTYGVSLPDNYVKFGDYLVSCGYTATRELMSLDQPPTALFATNLWMTLGTVMALNEMGVGIPDDVSLIGFDHYEVFDITRPALTVIEQPAEAIGVKAAELLLRRMGGDMAGFPENCRINTRMLVRDSIREIK